VSKQILVILFVLFTHPLFSSEPLGPEYCITYGDSTSSVTIREYFSFSCPECIRLYKREFAGIRKDYIDNGDVCWVFQPMPMDLLTVQAMVCLEKLSEDEKRTFLEATLMEFEGIDDALATLMMQKAMDFFEKPLPHLEDTSFLENTKAFRAAFKFVQSNDIEAVPTVDINGKRYEGIPDRRFINEKMTALLLGKGERL
jgi:hypothetical protein